MEEASVAMLMVVFVGVVIIFLVTWLIVSKWLTTRQEQLKRRMKPAEDSEPTIVLDDVLAGRGRPGILTRSYRWFQEILERTELGLEPAEALAIILFSGVVVAAIVFFWRYEEDESWLAAPAFLIGAGVPTFFIFWRQGLWRQRMQEQLPDTLFLLARSLRSGLSIDQSIRVVGDHGVPPISREFARMHRQLDLGLSLTHVTQNIAQRIRLVDFNVFASTVSLHRSTGGNLPVIVDRLAQATRDRNQFQGHYRSATALGRYGVAVIAAMVIIMLFYLFFFQREWAMHYFETTYGLVLFSVAITLEVAAGVALYFMLRNEY